MPATNAKLIVSGSTASRREILLHHFPLILGRSPSADVCIDDRWVSREHCEIDADDRGLIVRDIGSKHGTYVNGRLVTDIELHPGDEISVGLSRFVIEFHIAADSAKLTEKAYSAR
ncbi:MAG: FHA domain-containing protein [Planctomycetes bacterium]|nr:FHA domain-containing protein [Planctomycetota bacterium]